MSLREFSAKIAVFNFHPSFGAAPSFGLPPLFKRKKFRKFHINEFVKTIMA
jgi:hypothetical protein